MINTREYLEKTYQAVQAGRLYPAVFAGKRGRKTEPTRRLFTDLDSELSLTDDLVYLMLVNNELKYIPDNKPPYDNNPVRYAFYGSQNVENTIGGIIVPSSPGISLTSI
jgi:hypothetical protein